MTKVTKFNFATVHGNGVEHRIKFHSGDDVFARMFKLDDSNSLEATVAYLRMIADSIELGHEQITKGEGE